MSAKSESYEWRGIAPDGRPAAGGWDDITPAQLTAIVLDRHREGWDSLTVECGGREVARIRPVAGALSLRTCWVEDQPLPDRWQELKEWLILEAEASDGRRVAALSGKDFATANDQVVASSTYRAALAKMTELDARNG